MKKLSAIIIALLLVAVSAVSAFAAGINDNEKKVLDELKTSVKMQGTDMYWPDSYVNQAENYFNTIDLTGDQADQIISVIKSGKNYYLVNNVILTGEGQYSWKIEESGTSVAYGYNNVYSTKTGDCPYTGSGDTSGKVKADLGALSWDASVFAWKWNGTVSGGYTPITSGDFATAIGSGSSTFKSWLQSIGAINKDQLGTDRGSGNWWPGAYQN